MFSDRIALSSAEIFEKEFKIDARGYRLQEVDKFLDMIIHDYNEFNSIIKELAIKNNKLLEENEEGLTNVSSNKSSSVVDKLNNNRTTAWLKKWLLIRIRNTVSM